MQLVRAKPFGQAKGEHMTIMAEQINSAVVGGVDTHKDLHVAAVVDRQDGVLGTRSSATTRQGYRQMLAWMRSFGDLQRVGWSQPAAMAPAFCASCSKQTSRSGGNDSRQARPTQTREERRSRCAECGALAFPGKRTVTPRSRDGMIEALLVLVVCRKTAVRARRIA